MIKMKKIRRLLLKVKETPCCLFMFLNIGFRFQTTTLLSWLLGHVYASLCLGGSPYITTRHAKSAKCVLQWNARSPFMELSEEPGGLQSKWPQRVGHTEATQHTCTLYKYHKGQNDTWFLELCGRFQRNGHMFGPTCSSRMFPCFSGSRVHIFCH